MQIKNMNHEAPTRQSADLYNIVEFVAPKLKARDQTSLMCTSRAMYEALSPDYFWTGRWKPAREKATMGRAQFLTSANHLALRVRDLERQVEARTRLARRPHWPWSSANPHLSQASGDSEQFWREARACMRLLRDL